MSINWYPGHMVTARTKAAETMRTTDLVIEVLDARAPQSSCNPVFERLREAGQRPALKLLNKSVMSDPEQTRRWLQHYNAQPGVQAIALCAKRQGELERVLTACRALRPDRGAPDKPLRMMILGIPNVGKSTLMNAILKRHVAHVGDEPAITKIRMFHRLGPGMSLVDTPGMLWPGMEQATAYRLAALHSIGRGAYDDAHRQRAVLGQEVGRAGHRPRCGRPAERLSHRHARPDHPGDRRRDGDAGVISEAERRFPCFRSRYAPSASRRWPKNAANSSAQVTTSRSGRGSSL